MDQNSPPNQKAERSVPRGRPRIDAPVLSELDSSAGLSIERQVYQSLSMALMTGSIEPGAALTTRSLSAVFGVSPTPVREALKRLDANGALISRSKSAFFVNDPNQVDYAEILEIRLMLEGKAIRRAADRATKENLELIHKLNQDYARLQSMGRNILVEGLRANFRFHFEMYKLADSTQLINIIEILWLRIGPALHHYVPPRDDLRIISFHNQMVEALVNGDADAAEKAVVLDLTTAAEAIIPLLKPAPASCSQEIG
jgi:DNA-binding GntR family transcriptional regulator